MKLIYSFILFFSSLSAVTANAIPEYLKDPRLRLKSTGKELIKEFVFIPSGTFTFQEDSLGGAPKLVSIQGFFIQKYEVTNLWYKRFLFDVAQTRPERIPELMPDTMVWVNDYPFSFNEPMSRYYFSKEVYDNFPVVGLNYVQVMEFSAWANEKVKEFLSEFPKAQKHFGEIRLPMSAEWHYAALGGLKQTCFGFEMKKGDLPDCGVFGLYDSRKRRFRANYKTDEADFISDGCFHTCPVGRYAPNPFGLFDMAGNVAEWVSDVFIRHYYQGGAFEDFRTESDPEVRTVKGGSWADSYKDLRVTARKSLHSQSARSDVGFRLVASYR